MSIIHNALKKAQENLKNLGGKSSTNAQDVSTPDEKPRAEGTDISKLYDKFFQSQAEADVEILPAPAKKIPASLPQGSDIIGSAAVKKSIPAEAPETKKESPQQKINSTTPPSTTQAPNNFLVMAFVILLIIFAGTIFFKKPFSLNLSRFSQVIKILPRSQKPLAQIPAPAMTERPSPAEVKPATPLLTLPPIPQDITNPPPPKVSANINHLTLNGVSFIDGKYVALINGEIYGIGDSIGGIKVTNITLDGAEVTDGEKTTTLRVK